MKPLKRLNKKFFQRKTLTLAQNLLGKFIIRQVGGHRLIGKITETEAYYGPNDLASHASKGKTPRTQLMFDKPGLAYIYLIYGMYYCFNIVTETKNFPAAILIRSVEPITGLKQICKNRNKICNTGHSQNATSQAVNDLGMIKNLTNGPGKFCQAFQIDKKLNGENLITSKKLYLAYNPQIKIEPREIKKARRIGIDYAGKYKHKLWRFYLKNNQFVSQK